MQNKIQTRGGAFKVCEFLKLALCLIALLTFCGAAQAASFGTAVQQAVGQDWNLPIWTNGVDPAASPVAGNTYELVAGGGPSRLRNPVTGAPTTFPGDSLTIDAGQEIRWKGPGTTMVFPGVGGNPGLICNGCLLNVGDTFAVPIQGLVQFTGNCIFDNGNTAGRTQVYQAQVSGSGNITIVNATITDPVDFQNSANTYNGTWTVNSGYLKGSVTNSLGTNSITMAAGTILEVNYNHKCYGTITLNGSAQWKLHSDAQAGQLIVNGTTLANGTYTWAALNSTFPANFPAGGSGSVRVGPAGDAQGMISVSFEGRGDCAPGCTTLNAATNAGFIPLRNWNNIDNSSVFNGTTGALNDGNGGATAVTLSYDANDAWNNDLAGTPTTGDAAMFKGISKANGANHQNNYTFNNLSSGLYDLYVYLNVNGDGRIGDISCGGTTYYFTSQHTFAGTYIQATNTNPTGTRDTGNYVKFSAVSPNISGQLLTTFINRGDPDGIGIAGIQLIPVQAPVLISVASRGNPNAILVAFGAPLDSSGTNTANYSVSGGITINGASFVGSDSSQVKLSVSTLGFGNSYTVTVANVTSTGGATIAPNPSSKSFVHGSEFNAPSGLTVNQYIGPNSIASVRSAINGCSVPTHTANTINVAMEFQTSVNGNLADGNTFAEGNTDNYGTWIYGEFVAPTTGNYQFALSSDDNSELYVSTDASPANKVLLASQPAWNNFRAYISGQGGGTAAVPLPAPRPLVAGRRYYVEVVHAEGGGGDHVSVAVRKPGDAAIADNQLPIPRSLFATNKSVGCPPSFFFNNFGPVAVTDQPANLTVGELQPATLFVGLDGTPVLGSRPGYLVQWYSNNVPVNGASNQTYNFNPLRSANGAQYYAIAQNEFSSVTSAVATLTVIVDSTPPTLVKAVGSGVFTNVTVSFSEAVAITTATNIANYSITNSAGTPLTVFSAAVLNNTNVVLRTDVQTSGTRYTVVVNNVTDRAGIPNPIAANSTVSFTAWIFSPGFALMEVYSGIGGTAVAGLTGNANYPNNPDKRFYLTHIDSRDAYPDDSHDNYGARISGLFLPPVNSVTVYLRSDDASRLFASTTENPANETLVTEETGCCNAFSAHQANLTGLTPGNRYYYELLYKEGGGGDFGQVSVDGANVVPAQYLGVYANPDSVILNVTQPLASDYTNVYNTVRHFTIGATVTSLDGAVRPFQYQWSSNGIPLPGATGSSYTTTQLGPQDDGSVYSVVLLTPGAAVTNSSLLHVIPDTNGPVLLSVTTDASFQTITLTWNEIVDPGPASDSGNYYVTDAGANQLNLDLTVLIATNSDGGSVVTLHLDAGSNPQFTPDTTYNIEVGFQSDLVNNPTDPSGSGQIIDPDHGIVRSFHTLVLSPGFVRFDAYTNMPSPYTVPSFITLPVYPNSPSFSFYTNIVYWPQSLGAAPGYEHYVMRFSGFFLASETGTYQFNPDHDDDMRLRISSDDNPANIAANEMSAACCTGLLDGPTLNVAMTAGQRYYFELIVAENGGGDHAGLAVTTPSSAVISPIGAQYIASVVSPAAAPNAGISQDPQDQTIEENHQATFSVTVTNAGGTGASYQWQIDTGSGFVNIVGAVASSYTTPIEPLSADGYHFRALAFVPGKTMTSASATLHVNVDTNKPTVVRVSGTRGGTNVQVTFNEVVSISSAQNAANYVLSNSLGATLTIGTPVLGADGKTVLVPCDYLGVGSNYTLHVENVTDIATTPNTMDPTNVAFQSWIIGLGSAIRDFFYNVLEPTNALANLTNDPRYPYNPSFVDHFAQYSVNPALGDSGRDTYGARVSGYLVPPITGNYSFKLFSDDGGALNLSTDDSPTNLVNVITAEGDCGGCGGPVSAITYHLVAGQRYATEAIFEEGTGGDYIVISATLTPGDPNSYVPIDGAYVASLADPVGASITFTQQPMSTAVVANASAILSVGVTTTNDYGDYTQIAYQWQQFNGASWDNIPFANGAIYTTTPVGAGESRQYRCVVYIPGANATSTSATVNGPGALHIVNNGVSITLSWDGTGVLQEASDVAGPWTDSGNQSNPQTVSTPPGTKKFFKLR